MTREKLIDKYVESHADCRWMDASELRDLLNAFCKELQPQLPSAMEEVAGTSYDTQQYTPRPSVDIEDVARVQFAAHAKVFDKKRKAVFDWEQFKEVAGIFYGFGKKGSLKTEEREQPSDVEEAAEKYNLSLDHEGDLYVNESYIGDGWSADSIMKAYKAGAEWNTSIVEPIIQAAIYVYEDWMGGTMDEVRKSFERLGQLISPLRDEMLIQISKKEEQK